MSNIQKIEASSLIAELWQLHSLVKDLEEEEILESSSAGLHAAFKWLDELAALDVDEKYTDTVLKSPESGVLLASISRFRFLYNLKLEIEAAKSLLSSRNPWETLRNFTFYPNYIELARTEYKGSGLKPKDCVLFLGSGPLPLSLIVLCYEYGLLVIGIEQNGKRAALSREVIARLGLSESIRVIEGNHFSLPLETRCELYMVAAQAEPKKEVFGQLAKVLPGGSKVSYRLYEKGLRRVLDGSSVFKLPAGFEEYLRVQPKPPVNNTVVFLKRN
ncbi:MAG: nicotianamine synthase family protein [Methanosarcinaceae archaeon]|nr:nicotianamine synthase family protein [Methanosarcinaceae archaeon]